MPIEFQCNICGTKLRTPDGSSGKKTKCPKCETVLDIPEPPAALPPSPPAPPPSPSSGPADSGEWSGFESIGPRDFGESGNPYQAPVDFGREPSGHPDMAGAAVVTGDQLDFTQAYSMTFNTLKQNFLPFFILGLISIGYQGFTTVVGTILNLMSIHDPNLSLVYPIFSFTNNIVQSLLALGLSLCALELVRTGKTSVGTGFSIFSQILSLIVFGLLMMLLVAAVIGVPVGLFVLIGMAFQGAGGGDVGMIIAFCLIIPWVVIASIILGCRLMVVGPLLIVDRKVTAFEAFSLAWAITKRNALTILCINLVFGIGSMIGIICTLFLGTFLIVPFGLCLSAMCYHIMWKQYSVRIASQQATEW